MKLTINRNIIKTKNQKTGSIRRVFNKLNLFFDWTYFKKIKLGIAKPSILHYKTLYDKSKKLNAELLPGSHRKKNKITHTYMYRFFCLRLTYIKIEIIRKTKLRKIYKRMGILYENK